MDLLKLSINNDITKKEGCILQIMLRTVYMFETITKRVVYMN